MRFLVFLLMVCTANAQPQISIKDSAFIKELELPRQQPFDTGRKHGYVKDSLIYLLSEMDVYNLFDYATGMQLYGFNFSDYHIVGRLACRQCLLFCNHEEGKTHCHRNRCNETWIWMMRSNKKAFRSIPFKAYPEHIEYDFKGSRKSFIKDTLIIADADSTARWYINSGGDCKASFEFILRADNYYPVITLTERNFWGGCRAGGRWRFTIAFKNLPGVVHYSKSIILEKKRKFD